MVPFVITKLDLTTICGRHAGGRLEVAVACSGLGTHGMPVLTVGVRGACIHAPLVDRLLEIPIDIESGRLDGNLTISARDAQTWHTPAFGGRIRFVDAAWPCLQVDGRRRTSAASGQRWSPRHKAVLCGEPGYRVGGSTFGMRSTISARQTWILFSRTLAFTCTMRRACLVLCRCACQVESQRAVQLWDHCSVWTFVVKWRGKIELIDPAPGIKALTVCLLVRGHGPGPRCRAIPLHGGSGRRRGERTARDFGGPPAGPPNCRRCARDPALHWSAGGACLFRC